MQTARRMIGDGPEGTLYTLGLLTRWKDYYGTMPNIRRAAMAIAGSSNDDDQAAQCAALANFVRVSLVYQADPVNTELVQSPDLLLADISDHGTARGDCDDHVVLFCALAESLGIRCQVAGVCAPGTDYINHVIAIADLPQGEREIDLCAKMGFQPAYPKKLFAE